MPRFNVEFYKPRVLAPENTTFSGVLNTILDLAGVDRIRAGTDPAAILTIHRHEHEIFGEAARIRMDDLPSVIDVADGRRHDLDVEEHEGLGEEVHFLYDADLDVIAVQTRGHFRAADLANLFADLSDTTLEFQVMLSPDAVQKMQRVEQVTKINFKLARPRDLEGQRQPALNRVFQQIDQFDGMTAKMEITVGRARNRWLSRGAVEQIITAFQERPDEFQSLSISGAIRENEGQNAAAHPAIIDFIKGRLLYTEDVERRGRGKRLDTEGCRSALRRAIRQHRPYLRRLR
jgi:hypothetical protein